MEFYLKMFEAGCQQNGRLGNSESIVPPWKHQWTTRNQRTNLIGEQKARSHKGVHRSQVNAPLRKLSLNEMVGSFMHFTQTISPHPW